ncbi:MAG: hypothetical protein NVSMB59_19130 [Vulcanimicrobiaceae bacterium]
MFAIGLRHGADPDHLAAIDNLTRNANERYPATSRFVGTLFALGHSAMVLGIAALAASAGERLVHESAMLERVGSVASIVVLIAMAIFNAVALLRGPAFARPRARLLPRVLRDATHPFVAVPIGALFGLGFETSSQLVAYGAAFSSAHAFDGALLGAAFCGGMICTDTLDSVFVARVVTLSPTDAARARRPWLVAVTVVALVVACERIAEFVGVAPPIDELVFSALVVGTLVVTALGIFVNRRIVAARSARA